MTLFARPPASVVAPAFLVDAAARAAHNAQIAELHMLCMSRLDTSAAASMSVEQLRAEIEQKLIDIATERRIQVSAREQRQLARELVDDMVGLGPLEPLLADETITDIMVNGPDRVFIERRGRIEEVPVRVRDSAHLTRIAQRIASAVGRRIDEASPSVDARLADGSRVNIVLPPLTLNGPCLSIRKFGREEIDFQRLIAFGTLNQPIARILEIAAASRLNILVSGGTGAGKTTLLNALSRKIDEAERIITIEDAAELRLRQRHVVQMETRLPNIEGRGEVTTRDLVRNALRMRPDRIIVGEVRGAEAFDMLQAMNTGHDGSMSSIHANSARDALSRLEAMMQMINIGLSERSIRRQIASALDMVVHVHRQRDGTRRVVQVANLTDIDREGDYVLNDIIRFHAEGDGRDVRGHWEACPSEPSFLERLGYFDLAREWFAALRIAPP
jgi:pilus assembly protein CpaF